MASSSPDTASTTLEPPHGLVHDPQVLAGLRTLPGCPAVKVINAAQFAAMHTAHIVAHPPDGVLFPFLHGLEGDNVAQNTFFAAPARRRAPRFRGLVWAVADDDPLPLPARAPSSEEEDDDEDFDSDEDDDEDDLLPMDIDPPVRIVRGEHDTETAFIAPLDKPDEDAAKHMHPVHHRAAIQLQTADLPLDASSVVSSSTDGSFSPGTDVPMEISLPAPSPSPSPAPASSSGSSGSSFSSSELVPPPAPTHEQPAPQGEKKAVEEDRGEQLLTCTFRPRELLRRVGGERPVLSHAPAFAAAKPAAGHSGDSQDEEDGEWEFRPARVPDGISLRNFGIQVPIYATLSDIVVYAPAGLSSRTLQMQARRFAGAVSRKHAERCAAFGIDPKSDAPDAPLKYNVFVLDANAAALRAAVPELMMRLIEGGERRPGADSGCAPVGLGMGMDVDVTGVATAEPVGVNAETAPNTIDFAQRERDEMRELTRASEILSVFGGGSGGRYPFPSTGAAEEDERGREELATTTTASHWRPAVGQVFLGNSGDVPLGGGGVGASEDPFEYEATNDPRQAMGFDVCVECHEMAPFPALAHLRAAEDHLGMLDAMWDERVRAGVAPAGAIRPPPNANAVIHLPFPSSPPNTAQTMNSLLPIVAFLERCLRPVSPSSPQSSQNASGASSTASSVPATPGSRRWSTFPAGVSPAAFFPSPPPLAGSPGAPRTRALTSPVPSPAPPQPSRTRPLKVLIYSSDGYTESSPLALSLLMAVRRLSLPEAYLELQVAKRRSFFVYPGELGLLRRVEARIGGGEVFAPARGLGRRMSGAAIGSTGSLGSASGAGMASAAAAAAASSTNHDAPAASPTPYSRPSAKSVSFAPGTLVTPPIVTSQDGTVTRAGRPRARTSPWLPSFGDHQSWFNDPRFDGSFPSRVLPFLYLGNLNHASNAYMLHALGITHVVSVGECALVPPPGHGTAPGECTATGCRPNQSTNAHFIQGKGPGNQGSLWIEEREGRIKVLDIKGVCDDGIDTLEPQLEPICEWIEKARQEGGQVLVHCRVGVSRSATVTIAYVMKHLSLPLVDAYLIVRSRRLSVLIQPNMRLLYNLCGWEIKLAKERAGEDESRLRKELARTLTWPYLSKEVHALNEKYLH
ncbi:hypothetical protein B0H15DRAFT_853971 [Mycena belliarum]|uniref:Protein-tyrosine-phosphatase n=1 Tax=Mycena belliarum TaxID=1033014 RepID=A0AAD6U1U8_9AGAR|nr:hypothetical protein B0H15DRAFT_853971 [Mycena belliae]